MTRNKDRFWRFGSTFETFFYNLRQVDPTVKLLHYSKPKMGTTRLAADFDTLDFDDPTYDAGDMVASSYFLWVPFANRTRPGNWFNTKMRLGHSEDAAAFCLNSDRTKQAFLTLDELQVPYTKVAGWLQYSHGNVDLSLLRPLLRNGIGGDLHMYLSYRKGAFSKEFKEEHPQMKAIFVELPQSNFDLRLRRLQSIYPVETGPSALGRKNYPLGIRLRFVAESTNPPPADKANFTMLWIQQEIFVQHLVFHEVSSIIRDIDTPAIAEYPDMTLRSLLMGIATPGCDEVKHYPLFQSIRFYPERRGEPSTMFTFLTSAKKRARHILASLPVFCREAMNDKSVPCPFDQFFGDEYLREADNTEFDPVHNRVKGKTTQCPSKLASANDDPFINALVMIPAQQAFASYSVTDMAVDSPPSSANTPARPTSKRQATQSPGQSPPVASASTPPENTSNSNPKKRPKSNRSNRKQPPQTAQASTGDTSAGNTT